MTLADYPKNEWRIIGPPGTGKTTELGRRIRSTCKKFGSESLIVISFTRAAALELVGRDLPIDKERIGTLHSFAFRALGKPDIAESKQGIDLWNKNKKAPNAWKIGKKIDFENPHGEEEDSLQDGDKLLGEYGRYRNQKKEIPQIGAVNKFSTTWEEFKKTHKLYDFTDLIAETIKRKLPIPVPAQILYADEVQDFSALELDLVRMWGRSMRFVVLAGDDDQCIYGFRGSTPEGFLYPTLPAEKILVLPRSFRLPPKIKNYAEKWISDVKPRIEKTWEPREGESGEVKRWKFSYKNPYTLLEKINKILSNTDETIMVLGSCRYMLENTVRELRKQGLTYHNPYRPAEKAWNPIGKIAQRVQSFLITDHKSHQKPSSHTWKSVANWIEHVSREKAGLKRGAKTKVKKAAELDDLCDKPLTSTDFREVIGIDPPPRGDIEWLAQRLLGRLRPAYSYVFHICRERGAKTLVQTPRIIVGTIHSVKGGEADNVFLFPELSYAGREQYWGATKEKNAIRRIFYVGMTRAKKNLYLGEPAGKDPYEEPAIDWPKGLQEQKQEQEKDRTGRR